MAMRKILLTVLCICVGTAIFAQTASQLFAQAKTEKDPNAQIKLLSRVISKSPRLADAYHYRADAYLNLGKNKQALTDYTKTISLRPRDAFRYYARGLAYQKMNRLSQALADLSKAISLKPSYRDFYLARARVEASLEKYEDALRDYQKYLGKRKPSNTIAKEMIPVYLSAYRYDAAKKQLQVLQAAGDDSAEIHFLLGRVFYGQNRLDEAVSAYSKAINRDNAYTQAYRYRASAFKDMGDYPAALEDYTVLLKLQPEAIFYNRRGLVYEEMKQFKEAAQDYTRAIELMPKWAIPYNNRGFAKMHLKDWKGAMDDLQTAIRLDGSSPTPYVNLAGVYWLYKKDRKNTYDNLDKAVRRNFKNFESLYDEDQKGWMFKGINKTAEFRSVLYK